jgi:hypothetical protein
MESSILRNEFATLMVAPDTSTNRSHLLSRDHHMVTEISLDPPELETLTRIPYGLCRIWLDPDLTT